jgi:uncharacterized membrane protein YcaP (DUF421 family)
MTELGFLREMGQFALGLGLEPKDLNTLQVSLRGLLIFAAAIWIVRVADKRFLAQKTAYDAVLSFILASMLSRAINGSARMLPTIACGFVLVIAHRLLAHASARWPGFGGFIKGHDSILIENGVIHDSELRRHQLSREDLMEDLRLEGVEDISEIRIARLERSGDVSVIRRSQKNRDTNG